jgi:hypothetical protein
LVGGWNSFSHLFSAVYPAQWRSPPPPLCKRKGPSSCIVTLLVDSSRYLRELADAEPVRNSKKEEEEDERNPN